MYVQLECKKKESSVHAHTSVTGAPCDHKLGQAAESTWHCSLPVEQESALSDNM